MMVQISIVYYMANQVIGTRMVTHICVIFDSAADALLSRIRYLGSQRR